MSPENLSKARACALRLIKFRLRSEQEIRERLKRKDFSKDAVDATVDFLKRCGLLDDALFARLWASSRIKKPIGIRRIRFELKHKGIEPRLIEATLADLKGEFSEKEALEELVHLKLKKMGHLPLQKIKARLYGLLVRRGYATAEILDALDGAIKCPDEREEIE